MLTVILFSQTEIHQLFRLPALFEHYREHKSANHSLSFLQFLRIHYQRFEKDGDYQRDQQLPFRDVNCALVFMIITDAPPQQYGMQEREHLIRETVFPKDSLSFAPQLFLSDIFQPPRAFFS